MYYIVHALNSTLSTPYIYFITHDNYIKDNVDHACMHCHCFTYICLHALNILYSYCILKVICAKGNVRGFEGKSASNMDPRIM